MSELTPMKKLPYALTIWLILMLGLLLALDPAPARAGRGVLRLRIGVVQDGVARITPDDLRDAGVDLDIIDPRTFAMTSQGQPVAIRVAGEEDGRFDDGDYIEFFGQRFHGSLQDEKYTDENVYWLIIGDEPGPRIPDVRATPQWDLNPPRDFAAAVHAEENRYWYTQHRKDPPTQESWYWDQLRPYAARPGVTHTFTATVPYPIADQPFTLTVEENARTKVDHRTVIAFNDQPLVDETWRGKQRALFTATLPAGVAVSGVNTVTIGALLQPNVTSDWVYVNYWELAYRREFSAWQGRIDFRAEEDGPHEYAIDGWATPQVVILDISDPRSPRRLVEPATMAGETWTLRFRVDDAPGDHFWLQAESAIAKPASIALRPPLTDLRQPATGADVIIVTSQDLFPAAERLADWHRSRGYSSRVLFFQDLVDEFHDGVYHPRAVTNFLSWTQTQWPDPKPRYVLLFGDGHWNFKGYNPIRYPVDPIIVPPYLAWADPWQGEVPDDNRYADLDGDGRPDLAVGRIPVNDLTEAHAAVDKLTAYDEHARSQFWQRIALFIADDDPAVGDFAGDSDFIINNDLPSDLIPQRIYLHLTHPDADAVRQAIADAINRGAFMVQYAGHGSPDTWMKGVGWSVDDVELLDNAGRYPFVSTYNCLDGYFAYPGRSSIAETMLRKANGGSIAAISPTGLGLTSDQIRFRKTLMAVIFQEDVRTLGDALLLAKQRFFDQFGAHYLIETMTLFGDPTLTLPAGVYLHNAYAPLQLLPAPAPPAAPSLPRLPERTPSRLEPLTPPL